MELSILSLILLVLVVLNIVMYRALHLTKQQLAEFTNNKHNQADNKHNQTDIINPSSVDSITRLIMKTNVLKPGGYIMINHEKGIYAVSSSAVIFECQSGKGPTIGIAIAEFEPRLDKFVNEIRDRINKI